MRQISGVISDNCGQPKEEVQAEAHSLLSPNHITDVKNSSTIVTYSRVMIRPSCIVNITGNISGIFVIEIQTVFITCVCYLDSGLLAIVGLMI